MSVEPAIFREAMRNWATGVAIVTAQHSDIHHGMTVNSFTSVSLNPPLILVSLEQQTRTHRLVKRSNACGVTSQSRMQGSISERFATRDTEDLNRFTGFPTETMITGVPFLADGLAYFDFRCRSTIDAGTHTIFVGEVLAVQHNESFTPLLYFQGAYHGLQE